MQKAYKVFKNSCGIFFLFLLACGSAEEKNLADIVFINGVIYTVDESNPVAEAVAVRDGKILFVGSNLEIDEYTGEQTTQINLGGKTMTPGFIEGHGHMMGLGYNELNLDLSGVKNYDELVSHVADAVAKANPGDWIVGRGWHQSKWDPVPEEMVDGFQTHKKLSEISPENPVWLSHASGHAGFANARAMEIAGVNPLSIESLEQNVEGGEIITDALGNPTGIFSETAQGLIRRHIPENTPAMDRRALELAIKACQRNGITSFHDAGTGQGTIDLMQQFKEEGILGVRMYIMLAGRSEELINQWLEKGPVHDTADQLLTIRAIKLNADGALGNRGAWLLEEYTDRQGHFGFATMPLEYMERVTRDGLSAGFQVNTHAIGDRTNREILDIYEKVLTEIPEKATDHRFRIEHAQHLSLDDIPRFGELGVIASMEAIHMSSDRPWAIDRLGEKRIVDGAYVWQKLLQSGAIIVNGTDVPVEPIDPIACFYASVSRKTLAGIPEGGFEPEQKMSREEALRSYTLDAAYGEFAEEVKGSISPGKFADFTVFDQDIMTVPENQILDTKVTMTVFNGKVVYDGNPSM